MELVFGSKKTKEGEKNMKIGNIVIKYNAEMHLTKDQISLLNQNDIEWYPSLDIRQANGGWIWFDNKEEYKKAKKILKQNKKEKRTKRRNIK